EERLAPAGADRRRPIRAASSCSSQPQGGTVGRLGRHGVACSVMDSRFPSGSRNQATFEPSGVVHTPAGSCARPGKRSNVTPFPVRAVTVLFISSTAQPMTVYGGVVTD